MANQTTINPYVGIGQLLPSGLNSIISSLPPQPTEADLLNAVVTYVENVFYNGASAQVKIELYSIAANAANSYRGNLVLNGNALFNTNQMQFIQLLIGPEMAVGIAPDSFSDRIADIEDNIGISNLSVPEQIPLFLSTTIASNAEAYWKGQLANPLSSWVSYFSSNSGQNYLNSILWNTAAINGALSAYGATLDGLVEPSVNRVSNNMVSALIGALTVTAGKVIFNWIPRITKPLQLNVDTVSDITNSNPTNNGTARIWGTVLLCVLSTSKHCTDASCGNRTHGKFVILCLGS